MTIITCKDLNRLYTTKPNNSEDSDGIRDYFLKIIEVMPNLVFWVNKDSIALGCNRNELDMLGLESLDQFIGLSYEEIGALANWTKEQMAAFRQADQEVISTGIPKLNILEPPLRLKDNSVVHLLTSRVPLADDYGNIIGVVGISIDITDQLKAKEMSKQLAVEKERSQILETLGASIAHELRTPLASLRLANDVIMRELPNLMAFALKNSEEYEHMFPDSVANAKRFDKLKLLPEIMKNSIDSSNFIINTLLMNISEAQGVAESAVELSIRDVINKALHQYPLGCGERLLIKWENDSDFICKGKEIVFIYIIFNLIKNSLYYIRHANKGCIEIFLDTNSDDKYNLLIFKDTAQGIAADILPFIFEKFYSNRIGGTGLGLAFCKLSLETYDAKITCDSIEGDYTAFTLFFPKLESVNKSV